LEIRGTTATTHFLQWHGTVVIAASSTRLRVFYAPLSISVGQPRCGGPSRLGSAIVA
jgi:hypothetical protein